MSRVGNIIEAYAEDLEGLTRKECLDEDFSEAQCEVLEKALGKGAEGILTPDEQSQLEQAGFAKDFIRELAGDDEKKALRARVRWLADNLKDFGNPLPVLLEMETLGEDAADAIPKLIRILEDRYSNSATKNAVITILRKTGPAVEEAIPALIDVVASVAHPETDADVGWAAHSAIIALGEMGEKAAPAVPSLLLLYNYAKSTGIKIEIVKTFGKIGPKASPAIHTLLQILANDEGKSGASWLHPHARKALVQIGPEAIQTLFEIHISNNGNTKPTLLDISHHITPDSPESLMEPALKALENENGDVQAYAARFLGYFGPKAARAAPKLTSFLHDWSSLRKAKAIETLPKIGGAAVPGLISLLEGTDTTAALAAMEILENIKFPDVAPAIPLLQRISQESSDPKMVNAANSALDKLKAKMR